MKLKLNYIIISAFLAASQHAASAGILDGLSMEEMGTVNDNYKDTKRKLAAAATAAGKPVPDVDMTQFVNSVGVDNAKVAMSATQIAQAVNNLPAAKDAGITAPIPSDTTAITAAQAKIDKDVSDAKVQLGKPSSKVNGSLTDELTDWNALLLAQQEKADAQTQIDVLKNAGASAEVIAAAQAKIDALKVAEAQTTETNDIKAEIAGMKKSILDATSQADLDAILKKWTDLSADDQAKIKAVAKTEIDDLVQSGQNKAAALSKQANIDKAKAALEKDVADAKANLGKDTSKVDDSFSDELADLDAIEGAKKKKDAAQKDVEALKAAGASDADVKTAQANVDALDIDKRKANETANIKAQIADLKSKVQAAKSLADLNALKTAWDKLSKDQQDKVATVAKAEFDDLLKTANDKAAALGGGDNGKGDNGKGDNGKGDNGNGGGGSVNSKPLDTFNKDKISNQGGTVKTNTDGTQSITLGNVKASASADGSSVVSVAPGINSVKTGNSLTLTITESTKSGDLTNTLYVNSVISNNNGKVSILDSNTTLTADQMNKTSGDLILSVHSSQNNTYKHENMGNTIISNVGGAGAAGGFGSSGQGFSAVKKAMRANDRMADRMPNVFNALAENGPVVKDVQKFRFWLSPYASISNISEASEREKGFGALAGLTYRAAKFSVGFFFGYNTSKNEHNTLNKTAKTDGMSFGLNASANLWKDGVINFLYAYAPSTVKHEQQLGALAAQSEKQKNHAHVIDVNVGHSFKLGEAYALDLSLGNTSVFSKQGTYFGNVSTINGQSQEVYAGFGAAWNKPTQSGKVFVRGSYQFGYQYKNSNKTPNIPLFGASNIVVQGVNVEKRKSHYVGLSTGMDLNKSWGFSFGYNGTYAKKYQNHTVSGKIEYRM